MSVNPRINIATINSTDTKTAYFNGACYYDPQIQRFLSEDPIGFASGDFNFYRYVSNNPINFVDPSGKFWQYVAVVVVGGYAVKVWVKKWIEDRTSNTFYKQGFCNAYNASHSCESALLHMNSYCGTNVDCKDFSSELYRRCTNKTLDCENKGCE